MTGRGTLRPYLQVLFSSPKVKGHSSEEKLIGAAKQVAGSTAQLLLACKVKADPDSRSMKRLEAASNAVRKATDNLVKAAQQALEQVSMLQNSSSQTTRLHKLECLSLAMLIRLVQERLS